MNLALLQAGYPLAIIPPILRRDDLGTLDRTHQGDDRLFINFIAGVCCESSKEYLGLWERRRTTGNGSGLMNRTCSRNPARFPLLTTGPRQGADHVDGSIG